VSCGPGKLGDWLVPDLVFRSCCARHDGDYAGVGLTRKRADRRLLDCMKLAAGRRQGVKWLWYRVMARVYYHEVRIWGWVAWRRARRRNGRR